GFGGKIGGLVNLHDHADVLGSDERLLTGGDAFEEVDGLVRHGTCVDMSDAFAGHGRDGELDTLLHGGDVNVAMCIIHHYGAFSTDHFDPAAGEIGIGGRQHPAGADGEGRAVIHGDDDPGAVRDIILRAHNLADLLGVNADGFSRGEAPQDEIDVVRGFHGGGREFYTSADFLSEVARDVAADQGGDGLADAAIVDGALDVGEFGVEALRIADGEEQVSGAGKRDQIVGFFQLERDGLFEEHVLPGQDAFPGDGIMRGFRSGGNEDGIDGAVFEEHAVIGCGGDGVSEIGHFFKALRFNFGDVQVADERIFRAGLRADSSAPAGSDDGDING